MVRLGLDRTTKAPVLFLREAGGDRGLCIWIGAPEANAIALALQGATPTRPMTHDLLRHLLQGLGGELVRVAVTEARENTYFAELLIRRGDELLTVDARPSDAIALALRCHAPLLVANGLLHDAFDESPAGMRPLEADALRAYLERLDPQDFGRFQP